MNVFLLLEQQSLLSGAQSLSGGRGRGVGQGGRTHAGEWADGAQPGNEAPQVWSESRALPA